MGPDRPFTSLPVAVNRKNGKPKKPGPVDLMRYLGEKDDQLPDFQFAWSDDELRALLRDLANQIAAMFNRADAVGFGQFFTAAAVCVDGRRVIVRGREAIVAALTKFLSDNPGIQLEIDEQVARFVRPDVAVEFGKWTLLKGRQEIVEGVYTAVHIKNGGRWQIASLSHSLAIRP